MVGGFLIATAAVGIFAAYTNAVGGTSQRFLVARHDLPLGHRIVADDLASAPMDLPEPLRRRSASEPSRLVGAVVIGPVARGELIQASDVVRTGADTGLEIAFPVESARAVDGHLRVGEFVDVLATYESGAEGYTTVVVKGARIVDRSEPAGSLAGGDKEVVTLAVADRTESLAVAHAANAGAVTLVRVADPRRPPTEGITIYRTPGPASRGDATPAG